MAKVNQARIDALRNLLGQADINKVAPLFQTATPASYDLINAKFYQPYSMAASGAGDWTATPLERMSLKNYIQAVNSALMMPQELP